jgi:radical SAM superfamily enzyme YgiQ (UPF0313 family)
LINPPLSNPTGPYPAICYLAGFLDTIGIRAELADASLRLLLRLFSREGVDLLRREILARIPSGSAVPSGSLRAFLDRFAHYARTIDTAVATLQGTDEGAVVRAASPRYFPPSLNATEEWARTVFLNVQSHEALLGELTPAQRHRLADPGATLRHAFGTLGQADEARFRASAMLLDLAGVIRDSLDSDFRLNHYAERIRRDTATFAPLGRRLERPPELIDRLIDDIAEDLWQAHRPDVVGLSVPFPGNIVGAFRIARRFKQLDPAVRVIMGGGWVNTTLRDLRDPGVFDYVDYITLDDGERPLQCILEALQGLRSEDRLLRTFVRRDGGVLQINGAPECDVPGDGTGVPTYRGLPIRQYLSLRPSLQKRHALWHRRWNKLTLAKGCYWKKCAFCDTSLDYIGRYEPAPVDVIVDRIKQLKMETGESGFHFVDEAMPPALLRRLAERLVQDDLGITWWGNVRFEAALTPLAPRLAESGCCALTGGLEVASDRLLSLMEKGVTLEQVVRVTHAYATNGVMVHAYLIYGFPTQTAQETVDAFEYVRQMFEAGCLHSVAWHRFTLTAFSPVAAHPERFGIRFISKPKNPFSNYVLSYEEPGGIDHGQFGPGLHRATGLYMNGVGFDQPLQSWFEHDVPPPTVPPDFVRNIITRYEGPERKVAAV